MAEHIIIKVYGHVWPCTSNLMTELMPLMPFTDQDIDILSFDKDMLRISYEGMYFPLDEVLQIITQFLVEESQGKIDYIDLEEWSLKRHQIQGKQIILKKGNLNQALDFSGF